MIISQFCYNQNKLRFQIDTSIDDICTYPICEQGGTCSILKYEILGFSCDCVAEYYGSSCQHQYQYNVIEDKIIPLEVINPFTTGNILLRG